MATDPMLIDVSNEDCFSHECFGTTLEPDMVSTPSIPSPSQIVPENQEVEEHKEFDNFRSPTKVIKEWVPTCEEALVPKEGFKESSTSVKCKRKEKVRKRKLTREGCNAMVGFKRILDGKYFMSCLEVAGKDPEMLSLALKGISNVTKQLMELKGGTSESKAQELVSFIGSSAPEQVEILPLKQSNTKGSGKRIKGEKEEAMEQLKRRRLCKSCG
ncbi:hypothetical protein Cgig2_027381 [Carnegiea gigantea]|uniref:Uncharacterized protein n=1 Tax=Carnegiea gigantea TaxID=171969 RepID=A0A9Q1QDG9_9CARY|nr:hypothetical protein Cgig2_027381 [Carnegiea gigantea]